MTILMHAAGGGNAMALRAVAQAVRRVCDPQTVRLPSQPLTLWNARVM